jgi:hypothetical protein
VETADEDKLNKLSGDIYNRYDLSYEIRDIFRKFSDELNILESRKALVLHLKNYQKKLDEVSGLNGILQYLESSNPESFVKQELDKLSSLISAVHTLREDRQSLDKPPDAQTEFLDWLTNLNKTGLSFRKFRTYRHIWKEFSEDWSQTAIRDEYNLVIKTVQEFPLSITAEDGAGTVILKLAGFYSLDNNLKEWQQITHAFYEYLKDYLSMIVESAPAFIKKDLPDFPISKFTPVYDDINKKSPYKMKNVFLENPEILRAVEAAQRKGNDFIEERRRNFDASANSWKTKILDELTAIVEKTSVEEKDLTSLHRNLLSELRQWRKKVEVDVYETQSRIKQEKGTRKPIDSTLMNRLKNTLDDYDKAVNKIQYPYLRDPEVLPVYLSIPVTEAAGLSENHNVISATDRLKKNISNAHESDRQSAELWLTSENDVSKWSPAYKLSNALHQVLTEDRLIKIFAENNPDAIKNKVEQLLLNHKAVGLLRSLEEKELDKIIRVLEQENLRAKDIFLGVQTEKITFILSNIGVYAGEYIPVNSDSDTVNDETLRQIQDKIREDQFDVFLAHNTKDKPDILKINDYLLKKGIYSWIDVEQIPPGRWFQDVIQAIIPKIKSAAIFIGKHGIGRWQAVELRSFISQCVERDMPVIPVLLPGVTQMPDELVFLKELGFIQFEKSIDELSCLENLIWGVTGENHKILKKLNT